jgi:hypothetical protein
MTIPGATSDVRWICPEISRSGYSSGKTYIRFGLQVLAKALQFKEFQIWQVPCWLKRIRLQRERLQLAQGSLQPAQAMGASI